MKKIVILHDGSIEEKKELCADIVVSHDAVLPLSPDIAFSFLGLDDNEKKLHLVFNLIQDCDELWVFGDEKKGGLNMKKEIEMARLLNKNIRYWERG